jgi:hypothetical protein
MTTRLSRLAPTFITAAAALFLLVSVIPAEAVNCSSVCNQVRRACSHSAKGAFKAARIQCDQDSDTCSSDCVANAATCPGDCDTAAAACVTPCLGDTLCEAACGDSLAQCQLDCINCDDNCDSARGTCRDTAKADRDALRALCGDSRTTCNAVCVDPIDKNCVRGCTNDEHDCRGDAKKVEGQCKRACSSGTAKKACMRDCKKTNNLDQQLCEDSAMLCYAGCAGVDLTPTTTVPAP